MKLVVIESPYAGKVGRNVAYAKRCMKDSLARGEAPYASHLLYTQVLDDTNPKEREQGMTMGAVWSELADLVAVYYDYEISPGMVRGIIRAAKYGTPLEFRLIGRIVE